MREHPILFSGAMVRAILDDRKTQTRRIMKIQPQPVPMESGDDEPRLQIPWNAGRTMVRDEEMVWACPYGGVGDRLWVRETWAQPASLDPGPTVYRADYPACVPAGFTNIPPANAITWKPSIHMPRSASRLLLEITGVRVERLNDCSEADARAEGAHAWSTTGGDGYEDDGETAREQFADLWNSINGPGAWQTNPWVWVVEFQRITP